MDTTRSGGTTIAAIASAPGAGRRGIVRVSGPRSEYLVRATCTLEAGEGGEAGEGAEHGPLARGLYQVCFQDGRGAQPGLLLWMPGPRSFTRDDVAELHLPGAPALLACAFERLLTLGAVPAEPGEFTRRGGATRPRG